RYNGDSELVGDLAESWEWLDDITVVFHLRKNVTWHNGDPFVASDVVKSMVIRSDPQRSIDADTINEFVDKWEELDDYTVKLTLKKPSVGIMRLLSAVPGHGFILHPDYDEDTAGQSAETTIGTGPFMYESYEPGIAVKLVKNPNYFLEDMPYLEGIELRIISDYEAAMTGIRTGELDMIQGGDFQSYATLDEDPNIFVPPAFGFYGSRIVIDPSLPPTDDVRVRKALNLAVDRDMIVDAVLAGYGKPCWGSIIPEGRFGYSEELANVWSYDPDKALELMAEAGWTDTDGDGLLDKDGEPMTLRFVTWGPSWWSQTAEVIQANFRDIGVTVDLEPLPWAEYKTIREESMNKPKGELGIAHLLGTSIWGLDLSDYYNYFGMYNFTRYDNPELAGLLSQALSTTDDAEREALFIQAQKLEVDDAIWIASAWASYGEVVRTDVKNFQHLNETGCFAPLIWEVWLDK
ncbi:MAG: ABC transporter substrate-binding protein, partial [Anaerolineales bacterium]|nr:ABC transporter substrate-binding protein [Anaerolineales bacterium]